METLTTLSQSVPEIIGEAIRSSSRQRHCRQRRILFDGGRKTTGIDDGHIVDIVDSVPSVEDTVRR
jgi:hypothetical protein